MKNFEARKIKLLQNVKRLQDAIDLELDWFIAYIQEKDKHKRSFYEAMCLSKQEERIKVAKEVYERYK